MGDFVPLRLLVDMVVQRAYKDLADMSETVAPARERQAELMRYLHEARQRFLRLLVILRWLSKSGQAANVTAVVQEAHMKNLTVLETANALHGHVDAMALATLPSYDIPQAVDVLASGAYPRMPRNIELLLPDPPLLKSDVDRALAWLHMQIRGRMADEPAPRGLSHVGIGKGRLTLECEGLYRTAFTIDNNSATSPWRLLSLDVFVRDEWRLDAAHAPPLCERLVSSHHIRRLHMLMKNILDTNSTNPLSRCCAALHTFCLTLQLNTMLTQAEALQRTKWGSSAIVKQPTNTSLRIYFWPGFKDAVTQVEQATPTTNDTSHGSNSSGSSNSSSGNGVPCPAWGMLFSSPPFSLAAALPAPPRRSTDALEESWACVTLTAVSPLHKPRPGTLAAGERGQDGGGGRAAGSGQHRAGGGDGQGVTGDPGSGGHGQEAQEDDTSFVYDSMDFYIDVVATPTLLAADASDDDHQLTVGRTPNVHLLLQRVQQRLAQQLLVSLHAAIASAPATFAAGVCFRLSTHTNSDSRDSNIAKRKRSAAHKRAQRDAGVSLDAVFPLSVNTLNKDGLSTLKPEQDRLSLRVCHCTGQLLLGHDNTPSTDNKPAALRVVERVMNSDASTVPACMQAAIRICILDAIARRVASPSFATQVKMASLCGLSRAVDDDTAAFSRCFIFIDYPGHALMLTVTPSLGLRARVLACHLEAPHEVAATFPRRAGAPASGPAAGAKTGGSAGGSLTSPGATPTRLSTTPPSGPQSAATPGVRPANAAAAGGAAAANTATPSRSAGADAMDGPPPRVFHLPPAPRCAVAAALHMSTLRRGEKSDNNGDSASASQAQWSRLCRAPVMEGALRIDAVLTVPDALLSSPQQGAAPEVPAPMKPWLGLEHRRIQKQLRILRYIMLLSTVARQLQMDKIQHCLLFPKGGRDPSASKSTESMWQLLEKGVTVRVLNLTSSPLVPLKSAALHCAASGVCRWRVEMDVSGAPEWLRKAPTHTGDDPSALHGRFDWAAGTFTATSLTPATCVEALFRPWHTHMRFLELACRLRDPKYPYHRVLSMNALTTDGLEIGVHWAAATAGSPAKSDASASVVLGSGINSTATAPTAPGAGEASNTSGMHHSTTDASALAAGIFTLAGSWTSTSASSSSSTGSAKGDESGAKGTHATNSESSSTNNNNNSSDANIKEAAASAIGLAGDRAPVGPLLLLLRIVWRYRAGKFAVQYKSPTALPAAAKHSLLRICTALEEVLNNRRHGLTLLLPKLAILQPTLRLIHRAPAFNLLVLSRSSSRVMVSYCRAHMLEFKFGAKGTVLVRDTFHTAYRQHSALMHMHDGLQPVPMLPQFIQHLAPKLRDTGGGRVSCHGGVVFADAHSRHQVLPLKGDGEEADAMTTFVCVCGVREMFKRRCAAVGGAVLLDTPENNLELQLYVRPVRLLLRLESFSRLRAACSVDDGSPPFSQDMTKVLQRILDEKVTMPPYSQDGVSLFLRLLVLPVGPLTDILSISNYIDQGMNLCITVPPGLAFSGMKENETCGLVVERDATVPSSPVKSIGIVFLIRGNGSGVDRVVPLWFSPSTQQISLWTPDAKKVAPSVIKAFQPAKELIESKQGALQAQELPMFYLCSDLFSNSQLLQLFPTFDDLNLNAAHANS